MAIHQPSVERLVEVFSAIYVQEIDKLVKTPLASNPTRSFMEVPNENLVGGGDLNYHVMFLEHVISDTAVRKCFYTFRAALLASDQSSTTSWRWTAIRCGPHHG